MECNNILLDEHGGDTATSGLMECKRETRSSFLNKGDDDLSVFAYILSHCVF